MENENTNEKKKQIRLVIIGVVALLLLTLGATFAFFLIDTDNSTSKSSIKGDINKAGVATLVSGTSNLHINLKAADMAEANQGTEYYGDDLESNPYVLSEEEGTHTISQVQITDGEETTKYSCTAKVVVTMEIAEDNNMGSVLEPGDLILQFKGNLISEKLDLSEIKNEGTKEYNISFKLTGNTTEDIKAYIKLINREDNQNYLASRNLKVDIKTTELSCNIYTPDSKIALLRLKSNGKLTEELVYGLYRYQGNAIVNSFAKGVYANNITSVNRTYPKINNYICLGSDCSSEESNDMYRIIGINEDGEIKVIKSSPLSEKLQWWEDAYEEKQWPDSLAYEYLNNTYYNLLSIELKNKILEKEWLYNYNPLVENDFENADEYTQKLSETTTDEEKRPIIKEMSRLYANAEVKYELETNGKMNSNIGLINVADYCGSFENSKDANCFLTNRSILNIENLINEDLGLSWLTPNNDYDEMFLSISDVVVDYFGNGVLYSDGMLGGGAVNDSFYARPVFYLTSDIELSGEGTIESPFTIGIE